MTVVHALRSCATLGQAHQTSCWTRIHLTSIFRRYLANGQNKVLLCIGTCISRHVDTVVSDKETAFLIEVETPSKRFDCEEVPLSKYAKQVLCSSDAPMGVAWCITLAVVGQKRKRERESERERARERECVCERESERGKGGRAPQQALFCLKPWDKSHRSPALLQHLIRHKVPLVNLAIFRLRVEDFGSPGSNAADAILVLPPDFCL